MTERIKLIKQRDVILGVADAFRRQYGSSLVKEAGWQRGVTLGDIANALDHLDLNKATIDDVAAVIGNNSWTSNTCDVCGKENCEVLVRLGDEPDYDGRWVDVCPDCIADAALCARAEVKP
jgi:hypothetical protein